MFILDNKKFIFIIGAPRSGTTLLNKLLMLHPSINGVPFELTAFGKYIKSEVAIWNKELNFKNTIGRKQGLVEILTNEEFNNYQKQLLELVYNKINQQLPNSEYILEKYPSNALEYENITNYLRNIFFIHIIRDGRAVSLSLMSTKERLQFGAKNINKAVRIWKNHIEAGFKIKELNPEIYHELRYENLVSDPNTEISKIIEKLNLSFDDDFITKIENEIKIPTSNPNPKSIVNNKVANTNYWITDITIREKYVINKAAGNLLIKLGYAKPNWHINNIFEGLFMKIQNYALNILNRIQLVFR